LAFPEKCNAAGGIAQLPAEEPLRICEE